jgi:hypothetical protein
MVDRPVIPPLKVNTLAPDVFADACAGLFAFGGNIRLTFESYRANHATDPAPIERIEIGRLVIPVGAAMHLRDMLVNWFKKEGADLPKPSGPPVTLN